MNGKNGARMGGQFEGMMRRMTLGIAIMAAMTVGLGAIALVVVTQRGAALSQSEVLLWVGIASTPFLGFLAWTVWAHGGVRRSKPSPTEEWQRRFPE